MTKDVQAIINANDFWLEDGNLCASEEDLEIAMKEYAAEKAIAFAEWLWENVETDGGFPKDMRFILYNRESVTPEIAYTQFLNQQK